MRAEIEHTFPVTLGKMNKFVEDEVNSLDGVPFTVPPTTRVGCLFQLLRSGGLQVFLRRLWNQFRTTLPVMNPYASVSWSKTGTLVVVLQTLHPRVLRRLKLWLGDSTSSLGLQSSLSWVKCVIRCCPDSSVRETCLVDVELGEASCDLVMSLGSGAVTCVDSSGTRVRPRLFCHTVQFVRGLVPSSWPTYSHRCCCF